uniref:NAD-dependent epimerase/dehydratase family protein n=1 Tax=Halegenticoccus soli TaxID=1985678 RepID=UPI00117B6C78
MELSDKRVLVTGGAGLVGSHLAGLLAPDNRVVVADDLSKGTRERVPHDVEFIEADMTDPADVADVITSDVDVVFHFAAYTDTNYANPRQLFEENTEMTYNVLERMDD